MADLPPRVLSNGELIDIGGKRWRAVAFSAGGDGGGSLPKFAVSGFRPGGKRGHGAAAPRADGVGQCIPAEGYRDGEAALAPTDFSPSIAARFLRPRCLSRRKIGATVEERIVADNKCTDCLLDKARKGGVDVVFSASAHNLMTRSPRLDE